MKLQLYYPVKPLHFNQKFGNVMPVYTSMGLAGHNGIDFGAYHGQPVYAAHAGTCYPEIDSQGGNGVVIRSDKPYDYEGGQVYFKTIYWHLIDAYAAVKTGQYVQAGDLIGYADNTGTSTGDHVHFGLKPQAYDETDFAWITPGKSNGYLGAIDPEPYFNGKFAVDIQIGLILRIISLLKQLLPFATS